MYVSRPAHLEAVLDEVKVFSMTSTSFSIVLQQNKQLLGELVSILLHCRKRKFQDPDKGLQTLSDDLHTPKHTPHKHQQGRVKIYMLKLRIQTQCIDPKLKPLPVRHKGQTLTCMELRQSSRRETKGSNISRTDATEEFTLEFFKLPWSS